MMMKKIAAFSALLFCFVLGASAQHMGIKLSVPVSYQTRFGNFGVTGFAPSFVYSKGGRFFHQVEWTSLWVSRDPNLANGNGQIVTAGETRGGTVAITYQPTMFLGKQGDPFCLSFGMFATQRLSIFSFTPGLPDQFSNSSAVILTQLGVAVGGRFALKERFFLDTEILLTAAEFFAGRSEIEDPTITLENRVITFSNWNTGLSQVQLKIGVGMWL